MTYKNRSKTGAGFTIIEVLIVLAIAGLILLIVFLAVPALQRNSRNTSIKNDVQNVVGGVAEYQGANNGKLPNQISGEGTIKYEDTVSGSENQTEIDIQGTTIVDTVESGQVPTDNAEGPENGTIQIYIGKTCSNDSNSRAVAAVYSIETSSQPRTRQCTES